MQGMPKSHNKYQASDRLHTLHMGQRKLLVKGMAVLGLQDLYFLSMTSNWTVFYSCIGALFFLINAAFAAVYMLIPGAIANQSPPGFWGAFFFSVETLSTVGYGDMRPDPLLAHLIATAEIFMGLMGMSLMTGLTFARFSRPRARIMAAATPVICQHNGQQVLMLRAVNARKSMIVQASARLYVLIHQRTSEGHAMRKLLDLALVRDVHPMFFLSWTLIHVIDERSPLWGHDANSLADLGAELILTIDGSDEVTTQDMRSRHIYTHLDIRWNHVYEDMLQRDAQGREHVNYERLDHIRPQ